MSTDKGYIKVYRDIRDHWIWENSDYFKAWIDLIMMAQHEDRELLFNNEILKIPKGSFVTSVRRLADRWSWDKDRVLKFLRKLQASGMIDRKADRHKTVITLIKYGFYQSSGSTKQTPSGTPSGTLKGTHPRTQSGTHPRHNEYIKEDIIEGIKKEEEDSSQEISDEQAREWGWID